MLCFDVGLNEVRSTAANCRIRIELILKFFLKNRNFFGQKKESLCLGEIL
jgi:hypothetical protein